MFFQYLLIFTLIVFQTTVQKQLSQYFRNQRRKSNPSSQQKHNTPSTGASKRVKLESATDNPVTQKRNLQLLRDYKQGSISGKTLSTLIEDSYEERRKFIVQSATSCTEILEMCPYLSSIQHVSVACASCSLNANT